MLTYTDEVALEPLQKLFNRRVQPGMLSTWSKCYEILFVVDESLF